MTSDLVGFRIGYAKLGKVRFLGHRDVARLWERTLRKAGVPVAMSSGFTPRARLSFGLALPTGAESLIELLDVLVDPAGEIDVEGWKRAIHSSLPTGFSLTYFGVNDSRVSLQESVVASSWLLAVDHPDVDEAVDRVRTSATVMIERERKGEMHVDDIRPGILELEVLDSGQLDRLVAAMEPQPDIARIPAGSVTVVRALLTTSGRGIRPTELMKALVPGEEPWDRLVRVLRTRQWIEREGQRVDVLSDAMAHPQVCA